MNAMQARRHTEQSIARNPTTIVITRTQNTDDGAGGSYQETVELPAQTVRIFMSSMQAQTVSKVGGQIQTQSWGLLALWDADIVKGDEFQVDGRRFTVRTVSPASTGGAVTAMHADLEEVS